MGAISITIPLPRNDWGLAVNRAVIVLAGLLGVLCAMVVFYRIAHSLFLGPVASLQAVAVKAGQGDLSARADVRTGDEFQHFSETFNRMLESLAAGRQQLQEANRSLDIKLGELAQVNVALHEANKLKSEFLANVSHELRTPLNSIIGFADLLKDTAEGERPRRYVANILTSARGLLELINDLLDLAKIEAGRMDVRLEMLSTVDLCETLAGLMKPLADQKRLTVEIAAEPDLPLIRTDPSKVRQIIYNFLSNAIKFTPPEGRVTLGVRRVDAGFVALSVSDTGPGVAKEFQQVIFEKFRQLDGSVTREHQGTGLGLAISKELASLLGGGIRLESEPGQGATFTLTLPLDAAAAGVNPSVRLHASLVAG
jgi:signal transduction histidine kinase